MSPESYAANGYAKEDFCSEGRDDISRRLCPDLRAKKAGFTLKAEFQLGKRQKKRTRSAHPASRPLPFRSLQELRRHLNCCFQWLCFTISSRLDASPLRFSRSIPSNKAILADDKERQLTFDRKSPRLCRVDQIGCDQTLQGANVTINPAKFTTHQKEHGFQI